MTIQEAIDRTDNLKPNTISIEDKIMWLSLLDAQITTEILPQYLHCCEPMPEIPRYSNDDMTAELVVKYPYDEVYISYLGMKIDEVNGEGAKYNNSATMFNSLYQNWLNFYNRTHMHREIAQLRV